MDPCLIVGIPLFMLQTRINFVEQWDIPDENGARRRRRRRVTCPWLAANWKAPYWDILSHWVFDFFCVPSQCHFFCNDIFQLLTSSTFGLRLLAIQHRYYPTGPTVGCFQFQLSNRSAWRPYADWNLFIFRGTVMSWEEGISIFNGLELVPENRTMCS